MHVLTHSSRGITTTIKGSGSLRPARWCETFSYAVHVANGDENQDQLNVDVHLHLLGMGMVYYNLFEVVYIGGEIPKLKLGHVRAEARSMTCGVD